jgi:hypothetical protein
MHNLILAHTVIPSEAHTVVIFKDSDHLARFLFSDFVLLAR